MNKQKGSNGGMGLLSVLCLIFIVLKLAGLISWSWWWVLSPLWIYLALVIMVVILTLLSEGGR